MRKIKKYSNRKLYDTQEKKYISLFQIGELMEAGEQVLVIDNQSGEDITSQIITQILSKKKPDEQLPTDLVFQLLKRGGDTLGGYLKKTGSLWHNAVTFAEDEIEKIIASLLKNEDQSDKDDKGATLELIGKTEKIKSWIGEKVDQRITEALRLMKVATREDLEKLSSQVEGLTRKVENFETHHRKDT
jgi:polyhydroxyalkanoate synthesis repressor PhaR